MQLRLVLCLVRNDITIFLLNLTPRSPIPLLVFDGTKPLFAKQGCDQIHPERDQLRFWYLVLGSNGFFVWNCRFCMHASPLFLDSTMILSDQQLVIEQLILFRHPTQIVVRFTLVSNVVLQQLGEFVNFLSILHWAFPHVKMRIMRPQLCFPII